MGTAKQVGALRVDKPSVESILNPTEVPIDVTDQAVWQSLQEAGWCKAVTVKTNSSAHPSPGFIKCKADLIKMHGGENIKVLPYFDESTATFDNSGRLYMIIYREDPEDNTRHMPAQRC